jgi:hypothetical protein
MVRAVGASATLPTFRSFDVRVEGTYELDDALAIHADPVRGNFQPTIEFPRNRAARATLTANRPLSPWVAKTELSLRGEVRGRFPLAGGENDRALTDASVRGSVQSALELPIGTDMRFVTSGMIAGLYTPADVSPPVTELIYLGGPVSAPGYDYHSAVATFGYFAHAEFRVPAPFPSFSLGRYGRVPSRGTFAPYVHIAGTSGGPGRCVAVSEGEGTACRMANRVMPAFGAGYLTPFDVLRLDVSRGVGKNGRWLFSIDVTRDFWSIL